MTTIMRKSVLSVAGLAFAGGVFAGPIAAQPRCWFQALTEAEPRLPEPGPPPRTAHVAQRSGGPSWSSTVWSPSRPAPPRRRIPLPDRSGIWCRDSRVSGAPVTAGLH